MLKTAITAALVTATMASMACAQAPQTEKNVSMGMAQAIIAGDVEECTKSSYKVSVVIVDKAGMLAAALRGDGTSPHTIEFARMKAYTREPATRRRWNSSRRRQARTECCCARFPGVVAIGGGVPIKAGTETIGAVGMSAAGLRQGRSLCQGRHRQGRIQLELIRNRSISSARAPGAMHHAAMARLFALWRSGASQNLPCCLSNHLSLAAFCDSRAGGQGDRSARLRRP